MTLVAMVKLGPSSTSEHGLCKEESPQSLNRSTQVTQGKLGRFDWDNITQGHLLGAIYYGYIIGNLFGGFCVDIFGAKLIMSICMLISGIIQMISPWFAE